MNAAKARRQPSAFLVGALLYSAILAVQLYVGVRGSHGVFCYALDDAYIHMAIARNLALHGVWGLDPSAFASASSSPGWTLLLALAVKLAGDRVWLSLALNAAFAVSLLALADSALRRLRPDCSWSVRCALQAALVLVVPLPAMALIGMEHSAQAFSVVWLAAVAAEAIALPVNVPLKPRLLAGLLLSGFFAAAIRYEAVFFVVPIAVLLAWRRRFALAVAFLAACAIPPAAFAVFARRHGPFWLPFSVIAKANEQGHWHALLHGVSNSRMRVSELPLLLLLALGAALWQSQRTQQKPWSAPRVMLAIAIVAAATHLALAPLGWLLRYEAYLFAAALVALAANWTFRLSGILGCTLAALAAISFGERAWKGAVYPPLAMEDRYLQHLQPALFVAQNYPGATIVASDIGALSYYANVHVLDPAGLGSAEPDVMRKTHGAFTSADLARWAEEQNAQIAILETGWQQMRELVPPNWTLAQTWHLPRNVVYNNTEVSFFAVQPDGKQELAQRLAAFQLPEQVRRSAN